MNVETVIAIVTAVIALITSAASFAYNLIQSRKERIQKVILDNRIKYLYEIREGFTDVISLANIGAINSLKNSPDIKKEYFKSLFKGYGKIKTYIKPFYDIDKELLDALDKLYFHILAVINGETDDKQKLDIYREDFSDKYLKYDWAYWKYIQRQKDGNFMNSDDAFDNVYIKFVDGLKKK